MRIAVTGTPGVGKTTLAKLASQRFGWVLRSVHDLAAAHGLVVGHDAADDADVLDMDALAAIMAAETPDPGDRIEVLDGHLAHLLPVDAVWLVRCDPEVLEDRLVARGYETGKVAENLEAEAMDLVLQETMAGAAPVVQRDGTRRDPEALLSSFVDTEGNPLNTPDLESVDWSDWLLR